MPQLDQLSACPSCSEPLEQGDRFCGVCGAALSAATASVPAHTEPPVPAARVPERPAAEPTPTEPDFTLPPAAELPLRAGLPDQVPPPQPDPLMHGEQPPRTPAPPVAGVPDPRTADPRVMFDDSPRAEPARAPAEAGGTGMPDEPREPGQAGQADQPGRPRGSGPRCVACATGTVDDDGYCEHCGHKQPRERDHMESELPSVAAASDRGLRHHRNEDYFALFEAATSGGAPATVAVVCDGVSSATRPDEASAVAAQAAAASMRESVPTGAHPQQAMHNALVAASDAVSALAAEGPNEPSKNAPACTIVGALRADGILTVGWIGDSRAYWVPDDRAAPAARLTEDDSWAAQMVGAGIMNEAEAYADSRAHAITGWLGADAYEVDPHTASFKPDRPGVVVVCTDGLWNYAEPAEQMAEAVPSDAGTRPLQAAQHLVGYALDGGGQDNITVAVIPFPPLDTE